MSKTSAGNFFEDFRVGQVIRHATPRTITPGDIALYQGLYGGRFAVQSSAEFARGIGYREAPVDDLLVFHIILGKTVPDISLNAFANLGYADCRFLKTVNVGDTLTATSEVIGLKQNSNGKTGVVYVRTNGFNQNGDVVLTYARWVMVKKADEAAPAPETVIPELPKSVAAADLSGLSPVIGADAYDFGLAGSPYRWADYDVGEKIDHVDGATVEEAEHQIATRLYQNTAKVHFNHHAEKTSRFGRRLVYGGVTISIARSLSFNGLGNVYRVSAINAGSHVAPLFAGDTVYAWSEILEKAEIGDRSDIGAMRVRYVALKNQSAEEYPLKGSDGNYSDGVILDLDAWVILPT